MATHCPTPGAAARAAALLSAGFAVTVAGWIGSAASSSAAPLAAEPRAVVRQSAMQPAEGNAAWAALVPATIMHWAGSPDTLMRRAQLAGLLPESSESPAPGPAVERPAALDRRGPLTKAEADAVVAAGYALPADSRVVPVGRYRVSAWYKQPGPHATGIHGGLDFAAPEGTPVYAASSGKVTRSEWQGGAGQAVTIRTDDGLLVLYGHLSKLIAKKGQHVAAGQLIGKIGVTGHTTGPHLHVQVNNAGGKSHDPRIWLGAGKKQLIALGRP